MSVTLEPYFDYEKNCVYEEPQLFNGHSEWGRLVVKGEKNIIDDLSAEKYQSIPNEVKQRADEIFRSMKGQSTRKGDNKKRLLYYCVSNAYLELGISFCPLELGEIIELDHSRIRKCSSMFSPVNTGYSPPKNTKIKAWYYFPYFCKKTGLNDDAVDQLDNLYDEIYTIDSSIEDEKAHSLAAGMFEYYLKINGIDLGGKGKFASIAQLSPATINSAESLVAEIHNR